MILTDQALGFVVLAETLVPLLLAGLALWLPLSGRHRLMMACLGTAICAAAALALVGQFAGEQVADGPLIITTSTLAGAQHYREQPAAKAGHEVERNTAGRNESNTTRSDGPVRLVRVDRASAGMLALLAWLSLTSLVSDPRADVRERPGHVAVVLMLQGTTALALVADGAATLLAALAASAAIASVGIGLWGGREKRVAAERFLSIQIVSLISLAAAIAIAAGTVSLMQAAPFGVPQATSFSLSELSELFDAARRHHPAAIVVHAQLANWLLLVASVPFWLMAALFPLHGWFLPVWTAAPNSIRLWLGGINTKLPLVTLLSVIGPLSGEAFGTFLVLYITSAILGLLLTCFLPVTSVDFDRLSGTIVLISGHLTVLLACLGQVDLFLPFVVLSAAMVLLTLPLDLMAQIRHNGSSAPRLACGQGITWLPVVLVAGVAAFGVVPGGAAFELWRAMAAALWMEGAVLFGWGGWVVMIGGLIATCGLVSLVGRFGSNPPSPNASQGKTDTIPSGISNQACSEPIELPAVQRAALFVWGMAALLASVLTWVGRDGTPGSSPRREANALNARWIVEQIPDSPPRIQGP